MLQVHAESTVGSVGKNSKWLTRLCMERRERIKAQLLWGRRFRYLPVPSTTGRPCFTVPSASFSCVQRETTEVAPFLCTISRPFQKTSKTSVRTVVDCMRVGRLPLSLEPWGLNQGLHPCKAAEPWPLLYRIAKVVSEVIFLGFYPESSVLVNLTQEILLCSRRVTFCAPGSVLPEHFQLCLPQHTAHNHGDRS